MTYHRHGPNRPPLEPILLRALAAENLLLQRRELGARGGAGVESCDERTRILVGPAALDLVLLGQEDGVPMRDGREEEGQGEGGDGEVDVAGEEGLEEGRHFFSGYIMSCCWLEFLFLDFVRIGRRNPIATKSLLKSNLERYRTMLAPDLRKLAVGLVPMSLVLYLRNPSQGP
jgi:hypothetical protein